MIKNVLFDLDDTLLDFGKAEKNALTLAFTEKGINPTEELLSRYSVINEEHWKRLEKEGICSQRENYIIDACARSGARAALFICKRIWRA